jgi:hypothetical protein
MLEILYSLFMLMSTYIVEEVAELAPIKYKQVLMTFFINW